MKPLLIVVALVAVGIGIIYFVVRRGSGGVAVGSGPAPEDGQARIILTDTTTAAPGTGGSGGGFDLTGGGDGEASSKTNEEQNDALATDTLVEGGIGVPIVNQYPIQFLRDQKNPVTGETQSIFRLNEPSQFRIENPVAFAFSTEPYTPGKYRAPNTFVEILPTGSGSTAINVVESGLSRHPGSVQVSGTLKPGDPGYDAAVANVRKLIDQRSSGGTRTVIQATTIVGGPSKEPAPQTVKIGDIELKGNFATARKTTESKKASSSRVTGVTKTASGKGQKFEQIGRRAVLIRSGD